MGNTNPERKEFVYTYSAKEQDELKRIRSKYVTPPRVEDKMARLRKLDASVTNTAQAIALVFGVLGTLILGFGMSLCMTDLGDGLGLDHTVSVILGIIAGVVGGIAASFAYPVYNAILKAKRKRLAPEIIRLTDELMR